MADSTAVDNEGSPTCVTYFLAATLVMRFSTSSDAAGPGKQPLLTPAVSFHHGGILERAEHQALQLLLKLSKIRAYHYVACGGYTSSLRGCRRFLRTVAKEEAKENYGRGRDEIVSCSTASSQPAVCVLCVCVGCALAWCSCRRVGLAFFLLTLFI